MSSIRIPIIRELVGTASFVSISPIPSGFSGELTARSDNTDNITYRTVGETDESYLPPSAVAPFDSIDLNDIEFKGLNQVLIVQGQR